MTVSARLFFYTDLNSITPSLISTSPDWFEGMELLASTKPTSPISALIPLIQGRIFQTVPSLNNKRGVRIKVGNFPQAEGSPQNLGDGSYAGAGGEAQSGEP